MRKRKIMIIDEYERFAGKKLEKLSTIEAVAPRETGSICRDFLKKSARSPKNLDQNGNLKKLSELA